MLLKTGQQLLLLFCLLKTSKQASTPADSSYVAAVLEYNFAFSTDVNLQNYLAYIAEAAAEGADIIVFPELTLTLANNAIEVPIYGSLTENPIPSLAPTLYDPVLVSISAAAAAHSIYVVINIEERLNCSSTSSVGENCPESRVYLFNTNVVFDRTGAIIDRYRKIHLFGEFARSPSLDQELGIFTTDFGVTFGHFICFDLHYQVPAQQVVQRHNITDIIFTTMWYSELPFLTAVQIQQAYAHAMNVNLLASGANSVRVGSAGSGIFSGQAGALTATMPGRAVSRLLISRVPKVPGQVNGISYPGPTYDPPTDYDGLFLLVDPSVVSFATRPLIEGFQEFTVTHDEVSCRFRINFRYGEANQTYYYRAGVFDGIRTYSGFVSGGSRICGVFSCTNSSVESCGRRFDTYVANATGVFEELHIEASVPTPVLNTTLGANDSYYCPVSVDTTIMPLETHEYTFTERISSGRTIYEMSLRNKEKELYGFGIWGRHFVTDGETPTPPETGVQSIVEHSSNDSTVSRFSAGFLSACLFALWF